MSDRRDFLKVAALGAFAMTSASSPLTASPDPSPTGHELPALPYDYDALEPYIDGETMRIHHDKHHAGYVKGLNQAEEMLEKARAADDYSMVQHWSKKAAFNGGGHYLHSMFWQIMAPPANGGGGEPTGELLQMIRKSFGSFEAFKKQFAAAATSVEGSGWGLLHHRKSDNSLIVLQAENQHKLSEWGSTPILGIDVWEHAYYLKYKNDRAAYVNNWWNVVNWKMVASNLMK